jgi:hypothetical protein
MSVVQNPIIGRAKNKIGGVVFSTWKGINVIKGKPLSVANPKSDKQLMRRSALIQIVAIGRTIAAAIGLGFAEQAFRKSAFNAFTGYNLRNAFNYSGAPAANLQPENLLVSQGTIATTTVAPPICDVSANTVYVEYENAITAPGQSASDLCRVVVYNETQDKWAAPSAQALRNTGELTAAVPSGFFTAGDSVYVYVYFFNSATRKSSDSVALNVNAIA